MDVSKFEDWLDRGVGRVKESPIGKLFESAIGSVFEKLKTVPGLDENDRVKRNEFEICLIILAAAVIKADGETSPYELTYVKNFLSKNFDPTYIEAKMVTLENILEKEFSLKEVCQQIRKLKVHAVRIQLIHFLFGIADADIDIKPKEIEVIRHISKHLGISDKDYESIKAIFVSGKGIPSPKIMKNAYTILEINQDASDNEVKKAYRRLAKKYHPDLVQHLGPDVQKSAKEKFSILQEAYEKIKKDRGII